MTIRISKRRFLASAATMAALGTMIRRAEAAPTAVSFSMDSNSLTYAGLRIANVLGLFEKHGITLNLVAMNSGSDATTAMISGSTQFSGSGAGEILAARAHRQDVLIVAGLYRGMTGSLVLAKSAVEKLGVTVGQPVEQRLKAVDGLLIAGPSQASVQTLAVQQGAAMFGGKPQFIYMDQPAMPAALKSGAIQGFVSSAPYSNIPVTQGAGIIWINGPRGEFPSKFAPEWSNCVVCTHAYADANPAIVRALQDGLADLAHVIQVDPDTARGALIKAYPAIDPAVLASSFAQDGNNWAQPIVTVPQLEHERQLVAATGNIPGLDKLDLTLALRMPA